MPNVPVKFKDFVQQQINATGVTSCACGRGYGIIAGYEPKLLSTQAHCPNCGSGWLIAAKRLRRLVDANGVLVDCKGFTCRRCGNEFSEMDIFTNCNAPRMKEAKPPKAEPLPFGKSPDELKAALNKLRIAKGEKPLP